MIHTTKFKPRVVPYLNTNASNQIDRLQDMTVSITFNRTKIEEIGRTGVVDWRTGNPSVNMTLRQLEYGSMQFWQDLRNTGSADVRIDFKEFDTPKVFIEGYETDENDAFKSTIWYPNLRLSGFNINIGDPNSLVERTFTLVGEDEKVLQGNNKYLIYFDSGSASGGSPESFTLDDPTPVADPDNSGQFLFEVIRYNNSDGTTTKLLYEAGAGDPALGTDYYTYSAGTLKATTSAGDEVHVFYSAGTYIGGESTFTNNDTDAAGLEAKYCSVYLETSNYLYRLQSVAVDVTFDRFDVMEIGNKDVVQAGVRDHTVRVTLGRILDQWTVEEVLRGVVSDYGILDIRKFGNKKNLIIRVYDSNEKDNFKIGYKFTDLAPSSIDNGVPLNDYVTRSVILEGEAGFVTNDINEL